MSQRAPSPVVGALIGICLLVAFAWGIWRYAGYFGVAMLLMFVLGVVALFRAGAIKDRCGDELAVKRWEVIGLLAIICSGLTAIWTFLVAGGFNGPLVIR